MIQELFWTVYQLGRRIQRQRPLATLCNTVRGWRYFWRTYHQYSALASPDKQPRLVNLQPCLDDYTRVTPIEPIYFYQDAWAFEHIVKQHPEFHVDIGSHHKFVALLSKVLPVTMVDIRPLQLSLNSIDFREGSILDLPFQDNSLPSVSSLCVIEHIGLGRYGDPINPNGAEEAIEELKRVVQPGGNLYISLPINNTNRVYFNAHRAFKESYLRDLFFSLQCSRCPLYLWQPLCR